MTFLECGGLELLSQFISTPLEQQTQFALDCFQNICNCSKALEILGTSPSFGIDLVKSLCMLMDSPDDSLSISASTLLSLMCSYTQCRNSFAQNDGIPRITKMLTSKSEEKKLLGLKLITAISCGSQVDSKVLSCLIIIFFLIHS
jgi:hypothetical protein